MSDVAAPSAEDTVTSFAAGFVDWDDTTFEPESYGGGDYSPVRQLRLSKQWPQRPFEDRKFQLGGVERIAFLEENAFMAWVHRFNKQHMQSGVNGTRRCSIDESKGVTTCLACEHYEQAPIVETSSGRRKQARCGRRQQQFAMNVLVYKTDLEGNLLGPSIQGAPNGFNTGRIIILGPNGPVYQDDQSPAELQFEVFMFRFNADKFTALRQAKREWGSLTKQDFTLVLDPQKAEQFQDFSINISSKSAWRELAVSNQPAAQAVVGYFKENRYDLEAIVGKPSTDADMKVFMGFTQPAGGAPGTSRQVDPASLESVAAEITQSLSELHSGNQQIPQPAAEQAAAVATPPPPPPQDPALTSDFDALLNG